MIKINSYINTTKVLGPYSRFALWTQGCHFDCLGCMSKDTHDDTQGKNYTIDELVSNIEDKEKNISKQELGNLIEEYTNTMIME